MGRLPNPYLISTWSQMYTNIHIYVGLPVFHHTCFSGYKVLYSYTLTVDVSRYIQYGQQSEGHFWIEVRHTCKDKTCYWKKINMNLLISHKSTKVVICFWSFINVRHYIKDLHTAWTARHSLHQQLYQFRVFIMNRGYVIQP